MRWNERGVTLGLHYQLEDNTLGLCLACGVLIEGAEHGCVQYTEDALAILQKRKLAPSLLEVFFMAYKLQHYTYFALQPADAQGMLATIARYVLNEEAPTADAFAAVQLQATHSPIFVGKILAAKSVDESSALTKQYVQDIWRAYSD
jgi:hypothetical protein